MQIFNTNSSIFSQENTTFAKAHLFFAETHRTLTHRQQSVLRSTKRSYLFYCTYPQVNHISLWKSSSIISLNSTFVLLLHLIQPSQSYYIYMTGVELQFLFVFIDSKCKTLFVILHGPGSNQCPSDTESFLPTAYVG